MDELKQDQNTGLLEPNPHIFDWVAGGETGIVYEEKMPGGDWRMYKPTFERQRNDAFDSNFCITYSGHNVLEMLITQMIEKNGISPNALAFLKEEGYFDVNGKINFNDCFSAKLNGTTINGNYLEAFWNGVKKYGVIPEKDWISVRGAGVWQDLMKEIPRALLDKGQRFLKYFKINFEWVLMNEVNLLKCAYHLKQSPLHIASPVCSPWNTENVGMCDSRRLSHGTALMYAKEGDGYYILDHYKPEVKKLPVDYYIPYAIKGVVNNIKADVAPGFRHYFDQNKILRFGDTGPEIFALQAALKLEGFLKVNPTGNFLQLTRSAVIAFQEKYASEILAPLGLKYGTGVVSTMSIRKLNGLFNT